MTLDREALRRQMTKTAGTRVYVEDPVTDFALEMVVMTLPGHLVARTVPGQGHCFDHAILHQRAKTAVDGCHAQGGDLRARRLEHFLRRQRSLRSSYRSLNCGALAS